MSLKITHKHSTAAGTPPAAGDLDVGEIAINAADAELYTKDNAGNVRKFQNTTTGTADGVQFTQAGTGAVQRTVESKLQDVVSVKDFGAIGDGVADDTAAIQEALDWLTADTDAIFGFVNGGRSLFFPAGTYIVSESLIITPKPSVTIYGEGMASMIAASYDFNNALLKVGETSTITPGFRCLNLSFVGSTNPNLKGNTCLWLNNHYNALVSGCTFDRAFTSVRMSHVVHSGINNCELRRNGNNNDPGLYQGYGLILDDDGVNGGCSGVHVTDCEFWGGPDGQPTKYLKTNLWIRDCDGLYLTNSHMYNSQHAVLIEPDGIINNTIVTLQFNNTYFDTTIGPSVFITGSVKNSGTGNKVFREIMFSNCFFRNSTNNHVKVEIASDTDYKLNGLSFTGCLFSNCSDTSISNSSITGILESLSVTGCQFEGCNKAGGSTFGINAVGVKDFIATGNLFHDNESRQTTLSANLIDAYSAAVESNIKIANNNAAVQTTGTPYIYAPFATNNRISIKEDQGKLGGLVTIDRVTDTEIAGSTTDLISVIPVPEGFVGICEYTAIGNDATDANNGHQTTTGSFTFKRPVGSDVVLYDTVQPYNHTLGTLGANPIQVAVFTPNAHIKVVNNHTGSVVYSCRIRVMMRFVKA